MAKGILLTPKEKEDEPPSGLRVGSYFKRVGILNPAVVQNKRNEKDISLYSRLIYKDESGLNSCIVHNKCVLGEGGVSVKKDEKGFPLEELVFQAENPHGIRGVEDLRTSFVEGETPLHGFLVNYDGKTARTEYIRKNPSDSWDRFGVWFPNIKVAKALELIGDKGRGRYKKRWLEEYSFGNPKELFLGTKDCAMFPLKINGKKGIIIRILPDMQIVYVDDPIELARQEFWEEAIGDLGSRVLLQRKHDWEESHIGLAGPPFEVEKGIIIPYHGVVMNPERNYRFGLALVDKGDPQKVLARTQTPILEATEPWEKDGVVPGKVVFPTGHACYNGMIYWFYGARDEYVAFYSMEEKELINALTNKP